MAIAPVQTTTSGAKSGNSAGLAFGSNVTAGNFLVAAGATFHNTAGDAATAPTITGGGTWTVAVFNRHSTNAEQNWIAFCPSATGGATTVTVNPNGASADFSFSIGEFSGLVTDATAEDVNVSTEDPFTAAPAIASGALAQANELIVAVVSHNGATTTITPDGTYIELGEQENNSTAMAHGAQYKIVSSTSSDTADWAFGATRDVAMCLASFKEAAAGGGGTVIPTVIASYRRRRV